MTPAEHQEHERAKQFHLDALEVVRLVQPWQSVGVRKWISWSWPGRPIREGVV